MPVEVPALEPGQAVTVHETILRWDDGVEIIETPAMFLGHCGD